MEKVKSSREMLEELFKLQTDHPNDHNAVMEFARKIGACRTQQYHTGWAEYGEIFHNCLDIINLRQQIEQSDALSNQTTWIKWYTFGTFALVGVTFVLAVVTALIAIFKQS
jgi:hypothetical protein